MNEEQKERLLNLLLDEEPQSGASSGEPAVESPVRPLDRALEDRLVAAALSATAARANPAPPAPVRDIRSARRRIGWLAATPLAAAAAVVLFLRLSPSTNNPPLPQYELRIGVEQFLGTPGEDPGGERHATLDSEIAIDVKPARAVDGPVEVRKYLAGGGHLQPWTVQWPDPKAGRVKFEHQVRNLAGLGAGRWDIVVVVGRPGRIPSDPEIERIARAGGSTDQPDYRVLVRTLVIDQ